MGALHQPPPARTAEALFPSGKEASQYVNEADGKRVAIAMETIAETRQSLGMGDMTAKAPEVVGITKERWPASRGGSSA